MPELTGKRVVITRPPSQAEDFAAALREVGAVPVLFPVIQTAPMPDPAPLDRALLKLGCYDWMILTSANGVQAVWDRFQALGISGPPSSLKIAAIGPKTAAALRQHSIEPTFMPDSYIAEAIFPGLGDVRGIWILLPRADLARPALADLIRQAGGVAHEIPAYRTLPLEPDAEAVAALRQGVDIITFTSSSTVHNFVSSVRAAGLLPLRLPGAPRIACIGPITAATAQEYGYMVDVIAHEYTTAGLLEALQTAGGPTPTQ
jgi:uroporphyrinogen-III synthase